MKPNNYNGDDYLMNLDPQTNALLAGEDSK
jgi:hypothetical protein